MHRFIRLWQKLDWSIRDLDEVFFALDATSIDEDFLKNLAQVKRLYQELQLPLLLLLNFWTDIDTDGRDSLYIKLFQNKAVLNPIDEALNFGMPCH